MAGVVTQKAFSVFCREDCEETDARRFGVSTPGGAALSLRPLSRVEADQVAATLQPLVDTER